jgi:peptide/nickel transport system substrate-binding protein
MLLAREPLVVSAPATSYLRNKEVAEAVPGHLTKAGIRTSVRTFEWVTYSKPAFNHRAVPMFLIGWGNATRDADASVFSTFRSGSRFANYLNDKFDRLIGEAQVTVDLTRRRELYARAQRLMLDGEGVIPL